MSFVRRWLLACLLLGLSLLAGAADPVPLPALQQRVTDLTGTLQSGQQAELEGRLKALETATGAQVAILLLPSVQPESIEQFGIRLAEAWKLGRKGVDDGLIIIIAKGDRRMRLEVGYGLEGAIPDASAKRIVSEQMAPRFKQGDYFGGLSAAVDQVTHLLEAEGQGARPEASQSAAQVDTAGSAWWQDPASLILAAIFGAGILHALLGVMGYVVVAGIAGVIAFLSTASWLVAMGVAVAVFFLSLIGLGSSHGRRGGGYVGGWNSGSSSSDSGFSGGGGDFGGGGASGDW